jgi:hypothetical protein
VRANKTFQYQSKVHDATIAAPPLERDSRGERQNGGCNYHSAGIHPAQAPADLRDATKRRRENSGAVS